MQNNEREIENLSKIVASFLLSELEEHFVSFGNHQYKSRLQNNTSNYIPFIDHLHDYYFTSIENEKPNHGIRELLHQLRILEPRIGYHFLLFITGKLQNLQKQNLDIDKLSHRNKLKKLKKTTNQPKENQNGLHSILNSIPMLDCLSNSSSHAKNVVSNNKELSSSSSNNSHSGHTTNHNHHSSSSSSHSNFYKSYLSCINNKKQAFCLDCKLCAETDPDSFFWMLPQLCSFIEFSHSSEFVHCVVLHIDPPQFSKLLGSLMRGSFSLLGSHVYNILSKSLHWGSYEQSLLWQMVKAECSLDQLIHFLSPLLHDMKSPEKFGEALAGIVIVLKDSIHSSLIESIVTLPESFKLFPTDLLSYWFDLNSKETISVLSDLCDTLCDPDTRDTDKVHFSFFFKNYLDHWCNNNYPIRNHFPLIGQICYYFV